MKHILPYILLSLLGGCLPEENLQAPPKIELEEAIAHTAGSQDTLDLSGQYRFTLLPDSLVLQLKISSTSDLHQISGNVLSGSANFEKLGFDLLIDEWIKTENFQSDKEETLRFIIFPNDSPCAFSVISYDNFGLSDNMTVVSEIQ